MLLNLKNLLKDRECMHYSLYNFVPFFELVNLSRRFSQNSSKKSRFSKEFYYANLRSVATDRKRGDCSLPSSKEFANSQGSGVKQLKHY
jgi:hypothetical protein